jgi:hypothetical protein
MFTRSLVGKIINSRKDYFQSSGVKIFNRENLAEGGCGVIGIACNEKK